MESISITNIGLKRKTNQDFVFISEEPVGKLDNLFIVADGMGGHNAGDFASKYSVDKFVDHVKANTSDIPISIIRDAIEATNEAILEKTKHNEELKGMGTTFVVATIFGEHLYVANVGDSRLYIIDEGIRQITKDHSLVQEMIETGKLDQDDVRTHPNKNVITRAIGADKRIVVDFFEVNLQKGSIILMCSDGLTNMLKDEEIMNIVVNNNDRLDVAIESLVDRANEQGGKDNISIIIVKL